MRKFFTKITTLLLISAAFVACDAGLLDNSDVLNGDGILIINGTVSDKTDSSPLEDIKIIFKAYPANSSSRSVLTKTEYTSSKGIFVIKAEGFAADVHCVITAEDESGKYEGCSNEINVTWSGNAYNKETNTFAVNGCNFHMKKK